MKAAQMSVDAVTWMTQHMYMPLRNGPHSASCVSPVNTMLSERHEIAPRTLLIESAVQTFHPLASVTVAGCHLARSDSG